MLLHPSALKMDQEDLKELLVEFRISLIQDSLKGESRSIYFQDVFKKVNEFESVKNIHFQSYIDIINNIEIITVNSGETSTTLNFKIIKDRVIVGGNILSRGFTV
jgi:hypothetical protein